jgi:hypothetical protein
MGVSVTLVIQHAKRMPSSHKQHDFRKEVIEHNTYVCFDILYELCLKHLSFKFYRASLKPLFSFCLINNVAFINKYSNSRIGFSCEFALSGLRSSNNLERPTIHTVPLSDMELLKFIIKSI